jgi:hypothetical protein
VLIENFVSTPLKFPTTKWLDPTLLLNSNGHAFLLVVHITVMSVLLRIIVQLNLMCFE